MDGSWAVRTVPKLPGLELNVLTDTQDLIWAVGELLNIFLVSKYVCNQKEKWAVVVSWLV
jgi:hypothetical protein